MTKIVTKTVEVKGVNLPWEMWTPNPVFKDGVNLTPERPNPPELLKSGDVFISEDTLYELESQGRWDSQFGSALLLDPYKGLALEAKGWAERETRGGYHGTEKLKKWMRKKGLL